MSAPVISIGTPYSTMYSTIKLCNACDVCGGLGCLDSHGLCDRVNPEQTEGCFREPMHEGLHTFELNRAITVRSDGGS